MTELHLTERQASSAVLSMLISSTQEPQIARNTEIYKSGNGIVLNLEGDIADNAGYNAVQFNIFRKFWDQGKISVVVSLLNTPENPEDKVDHEIIDRVDENDFHDWLQRFEPQLQAMLSGLNPVGDNPESIDEYIDTEAEIVAEDAVYDEYEEVEEEIEEEIEETLEQIEQDDVDAEVGLTALRGSLAQLASDYANGHVPSVVVPENEDLRPMDEYDIAAANLLGESYDDSAFEGSDQDEEELALWESGEGVIDDSVFNGDHEEPDNENSESIPSYLSVVEYDDEDWESEHAEELANDLVVEDPENDLPDLGDLHTNLHEVGEDDYADAGIDDDDSVFDEEEDGAFVSTAANPIEAEPGDDIEGSRTGDDEPETGSEDEGDILNDDDYFKKLKDHGSEA